MPRLKVPGVRKGSVVTSSVTYDTSIGNGVDSNGFADLPLRSGAKYIFVGSGGSDSNTGLSHAQRLATPNAAQAKITDQAGDQVLLAEGSSFTQDLTNLANNRGFSLLYPTAFRSYNPSDPTNTALYGRATGSNRPVLNTGANSNFTYLPGGGSIPLGYYAFQGLDWNPGNLTDMSAVGIQNLGDGVLIENCIMRNCGIGLDKVGASNSLYHVIRNCAIYGTWSTTGTGGQGIYIFGADVTVEDCVLYHCGWKIGASRDDAVASGGTAVFKHPIYLEYGSSGTFRRNLIMEGSADAGKYIGTDVTFTENLIIKCPLLQLGGQGSDYTTESPAGHNIEASKNAIIGANDVNTSNVRRWGCYTFNCTSSSAFHHNLIARASSTASGHTFWTEAAHDVPSYMNYHDNVSYLQNTSGQTTIETGSFPAQVHATYNNNIWDDSASGTNTNNGSATFPNAYTLTSLYSALTATFPSITDETSFISYVTNNPEAHVTRTARALLMAGYGNGLS